jgi:predicted branched-subunit amino acid permease
MFTFSSQREAFRHGVFKTLGAPLWVLAAGMLGFGATGHTSGLDPWLLGLSSALIFALPGQIVMAEMLLSGSSFMAIALAVTLTSSRFITMTVTLFPQLAQSDKNKKLYAHVHLLAMTAWAVSMRDFAQVDPRYRLSYFLGLGLPCWLVALPATLIGYALAGSVPQPVTLALVFLNPLFFLLTFTEVKPLGNRIAILLGGLLGPVLYAVDPASSLLISGVLGGSLAYVISRQLSQKKQLQKEAA